MFLYFPLMFPVKPRGLHSLPCLNIARNDNFCDCPEDCADEVDWTCETCGIANDENREAVDVGAIGGRDVRWGYGMLWIVMAVIAMAKFVLF
jgi:hypothetical protein